METTCTNGTTVEALYSEYYPAIRRYLQGKVGDPQTAEDLAQETFIKVLRHNEQLGSIENISAWLFRIATNTALDHLRRKQHLVLVNLDDVTEQIAPAAEPGELLAEAEAVRLALNTLPDHYRLPLLLHSCGGYDLRSIGVALACKTGTLRSRLSRARQQFRKAYAA